ncbi:unnamed protein product [Ambrosiozyma monospora]|uniref:Unnamed protein product n=1 Tax=Ambrosiozyma monospora TaxID=43982 RepID=A0ACB5SZZ0_AMBMO|nr:unnamed protein product [Ambrosiozyma monospora]
MAPIMNKNKPVFYRRPETRKRRKKGTGHRKHYKPLRGIKLVKKTDEILALIQTHKEKLNAVKMKSKERLEQLDERIGELLDLKLVKQMVKEGVPEDDEGVKKQLKKCGELMKDEKDVYSLQF